MGSRVRTVFLVDDDPKVLIALQRLLSLKGFLVECFANGEDFIRSHDTDIPGCAVIDLGLPGMDGLALQRRLSSEAIPRQLVFITGRGDIPTSVRAMRGGAVDFLTKPVDSSDLIAAIERAIAMDAKLRHEHEARRSVDIRLATLTPREREVLDRVVAGWLNKQIAAELGTVEKTIKVHRGRMMSKMGARNVAELIGTLNRASPHE